MKDIETTRTDRILGSIKNHKALSAFVVGGIIIVALGSFFNSVGQIADFLSSLWPQDRGADVASEGRTPSSERSQIRFSPGSPFPDTIDLVKPGSRLSLALATYPSPPAVLYAMPAAPHLRVPIEGGPFKHVTYYFSLSEADPRIRNVTFVSRAETTPGEIKEALLRALGTAEVESSVTGGLLWRDRGGLRVTVNGQILSIEEAW